MTAAEIIGALVGIAALFGFCIKAAQYVLRSFHDAHVAPTIAQVTGAISHNTEATSALTSALAKTNEAQAKGFERMGDIIADHETRITVLEQPTRGPSAMRAKRKAS